MKKIIISLVALFLVQSCGVTNTMATNEIVPTADYKFGVKSASGKILIDTIYKLIVQLPNYSKLTLPVYEDAPEEPSDKYYLVRNDKAQVGIFDVDGRQVFDFVDGRELVLDEYTKTVVVIEKPNNGPEVSSLYTMDGKRLLDDKFQNIGYIKGGKLVVLVEKGRGDKILYLFNTAENTKSGPYDHLNVYNQQFRFPGGMEEPNLEKYKELNLITVRKRKENDYIWGAVDLEGKELLPMQFKRLGLFTTKDKKHPFYRNAIIPDGLDLLLIARPTSGPINSIFFDGNLVQYKAEKEGDVMTFKKVEE